MDFGKVLMESTSSETLFEIPFPGHPITVSDTVVVTWIIMVILIVSAFLLTRKMKTIPEGKQNFVETVVEFLNSMAKNSLGHHWKKFAPYLGTIFIFLIISNTVSIFNIIPTSEDLYKITGLEFFEHMPKFSIRPPTRDINVTACLAIMSMVFVAYAGIKVKRTSGWLKSFAEPSPILVPFKVLDYFTRPVSMCFRLFGNLLGSVIVMELLYMTIPAILPGLVSIYFDIFDGVLQAYVFVFLTSLYTAESIE